MSHLPAGLGVVVAVAGILAYLAVTRLARSRRYTTDGPAAVHAELTRLCHAADGRLARHGHEMTWGPRGGQPDACAYAGVCAGCRGTAVVEFTGPGQFDTECMFPLADDEGILACAGGGTR